MRHTDTGSARNRVTAVCLVALVAVFGLAQGVAGPREKSNKRGTSLSADEASFRSQTAATARNSTTPVTPAGQVSICHKGRTIQINKKAVNAHLRHGDSCGECGNPVPCP